MSSRRFRDVYEAKGRVGASLPAPTVPPPPRPPATPADSRWVLCSRELISQMMEGWSPAVELTVTKMDDTTLEFVARSHTCPRSPQNPRETT